MVCFSEKLIAKEVGGWVGGGFAIVRDEKVEISTAGAQCGYYR
jgi:hypothetical protein